MWFLLLVFTAFLLLALLLLLWPLWKTLPQQATGQATSAQERKALNITLYQQKLQQLEVDYRNDVLTEEDRQQAKEELQQHLLADIDAEPVYSQPLTQLSPFHIRILSFSLLLFISIFSLTFYLNIMPENLEMFLNLGNVKAEDKVAENIPDSHDMSEALKNLEARLQKNPEDAKGWRMLGRSYWVMKRIDDALIAYEKAFFLDKQNTDLLLDYIEVLLYKGEPESFHKAGQYLTTLLAQDPADVDALWFTGLLAYATGKVGWAKESWRKILTILPQESKKFTIVQHYLNKLEGTLPAVEGSVPVTKMLGHSY